MEPERISHIASQLRGALSSLRLAASQLAPASAREKDPDLDRRAALLDQSYYRLLRMVELLAASSDLEGPAPLSFQDRDVVELVGDVCDRAGDLAPLLGLELRFTCAMERRICAVDPQAVEDLLYHLLSNAFRATPAGGTVTVDLRRQGGTILLSVEDTGSGIPEERLERLFQGCGGEGDLHPMGSGLGLPLCRRIAEGHGGRLMAESQLGRGSRFTFSFPDRRGGGELRDVPLRYSAGFNATLLALADALPAKAFVLREQG